MFLTNLTSGPNFREYYIAGMKHQGFIEWNKDACHTLRKNYASEIVHEMDIRSCDFSHFHDVDIIAGGPPCQPFSLGGKHQGFSDSRDMFPTAIQGIRSLVPKAFIFENVKGLTRKSFSSYFNYILLQLTYPDIKKKDDQCWLEHLSILEQVHTKGIHDGLKYNVVFRLLNAADYGVPQKRERVIIVGIRNDLNISWNFPHPTHSEERLFWDKFVTGTYWDRCQVPKSRKEILSSAKKDKVERLIAQYGFFEPNLQAWKTVREALIDVPHPKEYPSFHKEHVFRDGARSYPGHTGSYIDEPSKALKAGDHGVPGGENMIRYEDGRVRYFTIFEAKRIQTFPDNYPITGSWTEAMRQIGNAVPVQLGYCIAQSLIKEIEGTAYSHVIAA